MNYKKIIKSRAVRSKILRLLRFIPDEQMLRLQYRIKTGRGLNLDHPVRFTEKLQWYKLHYRNPLMHVCADKYAVRDYVKSRGLEEILVPLIARYPTVDEVEWDKLPPRFVIKTTNGGGGLNVIVCPDKAKLNTDEAREKLRPVKKRPRTGGREWAYYGLEPGIVVEELLVNEQRPEAGINDYKFFCYNGSARYIIVDTDRYIGHKRNFYDRDWNNLGITSDCPATALRTCRQEGLSRSETLRDRLERYGYPAFVYKVDMTYRTMTGMFLDRNEAKRYCKLIRRNTKEVDAIVKSAMVPESELESFLDWWSEQK